MDIFQFKQHLNNVMESLKRELAGLRTGRATPALVEDIDVDCYGSKTPLKAIAAISNPEPRVLVIQPWDKTLLPAIERAISLSSVGANPIADRELIRLSIPALTEERRKELAKVLGKHVEQARISVRQAREDALRLVDRAEKEKQISEDEKFRRKHEIQKMVDEYNRKIEESAAVKEKEIMGV